MRTVVQREPMRNELAVPLEDFKGHARVSVDDDDYFMTLMIMTASAEVEHFGQLALLPQLITVTVTDPLPGPVLTLPVSPARADAVQSVIIDGAPFEDFQLVAGQRPFLIWGPAYRAQRPRLVTVRYLAGFGADAGAIPVELRQAIMDQALMHYDNRGPVDAKSFTMSQHMARIGARYRGVSI